MKNMMIRQKKKKVDEEREENNRKNCEEAEVPSCIELPLPQFL